MAKAPAKTNWKLIGGMVVILIIGVVYATGGDDKAPIKKPVVKAKSTTDKTKDNYKPEDYKASFAALKEEPKDSFKPLVAKITAGMTVGAGLTDSAVGMDLTGGEGNWIYTGNPELDGVRSALIENMTTGESVFLKVGDHWKLAMVKSIGTDSMVFVGNDGEPRTVKLLDPSVNPQKGAKAPATVASVAPVQPPALNGAIGGNGMSLAADNGPTPQELAAAGQMQYGGRGGRRNGGGGGRGRGRGQGQGNDNGN